MKVNLVPVYFKSAEDPNFVRQLNNLRVLLEEEANLLTPAELGSVLPEADAVVFPQMLGEAYRSLDDIKTIQIPILVITSEFGTVSMWDWEINSYLASKGIHVLAPPSMEYTRKILRNLQLKKELKQSRFLVFQDNPGEGMQADIFKRFYWWEDECLQAMRDKFGVTVVKKSFQDLATRAKEILDADAKAAWQLWNDRIPLGAMSLRSLLSAVKIYLAVKDELDQDPSVIAAGINCLNESHFSDTTPCLAWNMLFEDRRLVWGCEADVVAMLTKVLVQKSLDVPFMMTNLYPFLMGMAALKHERISNFPPVQSEPENHILAAHCGYFGVVPQSFSTEWTLREKVLAIVDDNATAIDARMAEGDITLVKLMPPFDVISVVEGKLLEYAQFPGSDCRNGAVIRVPNGPRLLEEMASHHYVVTIGKNLPGLELMGKIFGVQTRLIQ
ncbi:MAG TPA: hypothetical protein VJ436_06030 [Anaerolineales bacterium]|nr:hypothetical protein [Anaerolineales bacterium]